MLQGRPKVVQDGVATYFQPPLRDWSFFQNEPRTSPGLRAAAPRGLSLKLIGNVAQQTRCPFGILIASTRLSSMPARNDNHLTELRC